MHRSAVVVVPLVAALVVPGCGWIRVGSPKVTTWEQPRGPVELKERAVRPVSSSIVWSSILVELEAAPVCQRQVWATEQAEIRERSDGRRKFGKAAPFLGAALIIGGGALFVSEITSDEISPVVVPLSIVPFVTGIGLALMGKPLQRTTFRTRTEDRPGRSYLSETECPDDVEFAWGEDLMQTLRLDTPWGTTVQGSASPRPGEERTVWFSTKLDQAPFLYDDDLIDKLRSGWTLHLGAGRTYPLELSDAQVKKLQVTARQTALERGRFPPEGPAARPAENCGPEQALARDVEATVTKHAGACDAMVTALDEIRATHGAAIDRLEAWGKTADADAKAPCGYALGAPVKQALEGCRAALPRWARVLEY